MKRIYTFLFVTMAMLLLSVNSAWAQYVRVTNGMKMSWVAAPTSSFSLPIDI